MKQVKKKSVLVSGFNSRPLVSSLKQAGYEIRVVDFFGDLDLYPLVKDSIILTKELGKNYSLLRKDYGKFLTSYTIEMMLKYRFIDYLIIGSGLDDGFEERELILKTIKENELTIKYANNDTPVVKNARNIIKLHEILKDKGFSVPKTVSFTAYKKNQTLLEYPLVLKKRTGSGGVNVYKFENSRELNFLIKRLSISNDFNPEEWIVQEFLKGIPVSCTTISNGKESKVVSINRQIIGLNYLNPPSEFMYCGNIVPANLLKSDNDKIVKVSLFLSWYLGLKGINGFDFVLKNHQPYFMEINPRIPGSINVSEAALNLNLLDLHLKSFDKSNWEEINEIFDKVQPKQFATKLIFFSPHAISEQKIEQINCLKHLHDKTIPKKRANKGDPLCTILYVNNSFNSSFFGALKIVDKIYKILESTPFLKN
ncbi:MAG: ATP-grasp domain-containing protein [Promethearchaeota archaeon]